MNKILLSVFIVLISFVSSFAQDSKPLKILEKQYPQLPKNSGNNDSQGTIILRVEFLANGKIGKVSPMTTLPFIPVDSVIEAVQKIKFEPEIKNGNPINISKLIQYVYKWGGWNADSDLILFSKESISKIDAKAEEIFKKAVQNVGGDKYLQATSQTGRGRYAQMRDNAVISFQSFVDVIVFPDKERTEFKGAAKTVQVNVGGTGWIYDGDAAIIKEQTAAQVEDYKRGNRVSLDNLLRGNWRNNGGVLTYVGKRAGTLGKRNDVLKLAFPDDFAVEFEFADDGLPVKASYQRTNNAGETTKEEDHYAQFVEVDGIKTPFIVDRFSNNVQTSRINYESIEFNKKISDAVFVKPKNAKDAKKDAKF